MQVQRFDIADVLLLTPKRHGDARGWLSEVYSRRALEQVGLSDDFVQDNHAFSALAGTVRGLHLQAPPHAHAKLVRCTRGRVFDVVVDVRPGSPSFGRWASAELSAENGAMLYAPRGFAHGYCTLEPDCEVLYKLTDFYAPHAERGVVWNDPAIGIDWPVTAEAAVLNARDRALPPLAALEPCDFS
jgi:dTDP-4-dehydrorhamnose 3,5-epimerase